MSSNITNPASYLRTSRTFPQEAQPLSVEINKSYVDIANAVNNRTIGLYPTNRPAVTGESWFVNQNQRQQTLRQVFNITGAGNYPHNLNFDSLYGFSAIYGTFTDGTFWFPLPYINVTSALNQIALVIDQTNILIIVGGGSPPTIVRGFVVLEWLSNP